MKVLVFGAGGQLGRALAQVPPVGVELLALGHEDCDVRSEASVRRAMAAFLPDLVVNAAAFTDVDLAESEQGACFAANAEGPRTIAACARQCGARMVHLSTDYVFDGASSRPCRPGDATSPINAYGRSKAEGERAVLEVLPDVLVVRTAWLYATEGRNFVNTMLRLMGEGGAIRIVDDQVGTPTCADSLAGALWRLVEAGAEGIHHYTDAGVASWYDFGVAIGEEAAALGLIGRVPEVVPVPAAAFPSAARRPAWSVLDKSATWELLGGSAPHWRVALRAMLGQKAARG